MSADPREEELALLRRILARERAAREHAENLLEGKSSDLYATLGRLRGVIEELDAARRKAELHSAAKGLFLADMSHELRTPLNAVIGYAEMIAEDPAGPSVAADARRIVSASRGLLDLINNVLEYSRAESGRLELQLEPVDLATVVEEAITIVAPMALEVGVSVQRHGGDGPEGFVVVCDVVCLRRILLNLLSNAIKHTPGGAIVVTTHREADDFSITVADTGRGMDAAQLETLFEPFQQVRREVGMRFASSGLGMSITRRLVLLLGGRIDVQSAVGQGTTVTVVLPCAGPEGGGEE